MSFISTTIEIEYINSGRDAFYFYHVFVHYSGCVLHSPIWMIGGKKFFYIKSMSQKKAFSFLITVFFLINCISLCFPNHRSSRTEHFTERHIDSKNERHPQPLLKQLISTVIYITFILKQYWTMFCLIETYNEIHRRQI